MTTAESNLMKDVFEGIEATVSRPDDHNFTSLPMAFALHAARDKVKQFEHASDDEYFHELIHVIFSSGLPTRLASDRMNTLDQRFADFRSVADYDNHHVAPLLEGPAMARHDRKIRRIIAVAKAFRSIVSEVGSFRGYLESMGGKDLGSAWSLRADLMRRFTYLGKCTSIRFLIEVGYPILKPDSEVLRVLARLKLVSPAVARGNGGDHAKFNEAQVLAAMEVGYHMAAATGKPIQYISDVLAAFAQGAIPETQIGSVAICTEQNPKCDICGVKDLCRYSRKTEAIAPSVTPSTPLTREAMHA